MRLLRWSIAVLCTVVLATSVVPAPAQSSLEQARSEREQVRRERAAAAVQLDVSRAADAELAAALADLTAQVSAQQGMVEEARRQLEAAQAARQAAEERVAEAVAAQAGLWDQLRDRAVAGFVGEGLSSTASLLSTDDPTLALRRTTLIAHVHSDTGELIEGLRALGEDRVLAQAEADAAMRAAQELEGHLRLVLADLEEQREAQAALKAEMARRVAGWESQVAAFAQEEQELTAFIQAEVAAAEARRKAAEEEARRQAAEQEARRQAAAQEEASRQAAAQVEASRQAAARSRPAEQAVTVAPSRSAPSEGSGDDDEAVDEPSAAPSAPAPRATSSSGFQWPVPGRVSSGFGYRVHPIFGTRRLHAGLDVSAASGTPIRAAAGGTVLSSGWRDGYGNTVTILHDGGLVTLYAHQTRTAVSSGEEVSGGQVIGYVGSTGWSTGPHLHFEVRVNGTAVDPRPYLP